MMVIMKNGYTKIELEAIMKRRSRSRGPTMAPAYDRARSEPVNVTDYDVTTDLQGRGFAVERVTHDEGSTASAHVKWHEISA